MRQPYCAEDRPVILLIADILHFWQTCLPADPLRRAISIVPHPSAVRVVVTALNFEVCEAAPENTAAPFLPG